MVSVKVVYGSVYARMAGTPDEMVELDDPTIDGLLRAIKRRHSQALSGALIEPGGGLLTGAAVFANGKAVSTHTVFAEADEIVILLNLEGG